MKRVLILFLMSIAVISHAQDLHFTQTFHTPLLINPGAAGVYNGWERVIVNHRNQWLGAGTQFTTTNVGVDFNIGKTKLNDKAHLGVGILFNNDIGGDAKFGSQTGSLTLSGVLPFGRTGHVLSLGIQSGFGMRSASVSALKFMSQWNGNQFDQTLLSGEENTLNTMSYFDASSGIYYEYDVNNSSFQRNNNFKIQAGFSIYHINQPMMRFTTIDGNRLNRKYVLQAGVVADLPNRDWAVDGNVLQFIQGPHLETILGLIMRYRLNDGASITGFSQDAYIGFGAYYRVNDAIAPTIALQFKGFKFNVSYDITTSIMRKAYYGGSLEFSLTYTNLNYSLFKKRWR